MSKKSKARKRAEREAASAQVANQQSPTATYPLSDPNAWDKLFGPQLNAISPQTAMTHGAVYRCVFLIAGCISMLDFRSYRNAGTPDEEWETDSPQARLIGERPNPRYSLTGFWRSVVSDMLLNGNGVAWIERAVSGVPLALWWIPWGRVGIHFQKMPWGDVDLVYTLTLDSGEWVVAHQDDVMHFGGTPQWNLFYYETPIKAYALSVGIALAADKYAKAYFDNGMSSDAVISYADKKTPAQAKEIRDYLKERFGGDNRFSGPLVLDGNAKYEPLRINAQDAQLLGSREFSRSDVGMIFGVPDHLLNQTSKSTAFGKGIEELTQAFIDFTLGPHLKTIEDEVNYKLYGNRQRRARFDRDSFVRGDLKSRAEAIQTMLGGAQGPGVISQNEARIRLGMPGKRGDAYNQILGWGAPQKPAGAAEPPAPGEKPLPDPAAPIKEKA